MARIGTPLGQLRDVLQYMNRDQRRAALDTLPPRVQAALVLFIETVQSIPVLSAKPVTPDTSTASEPAFVPSATSNVSVGTCPATQSNSASTYKAHIHVKALRLYTRGHSCLEVALERQMVLVQLRQALSMASVKDAQFWEHPGSAYKICSEVMQANGTCETELGLSAYVYFRAGHLLNQNSTIISPVMPLVEVLELHGRLLRARRTSWNELRAVWIELMQCDRQPIGKRKSFKEAEAIADAARATALDIQLRRATNCVDKALDLEELRGRRRRKVIAQIEARKKRKEERARNSASAAERRARKAQEKAWKERRRRWRLGCQL